MSTSQIRHKNVILPLSNMMYPFMTLDDNAEIVHSEMGKDGFSQTVENSMDALWVSGKWNNEKNEEILKEHLRTPYKGKVP